MDKYQVYIAISLPKQSRIISYGQDGEDVYMAFIIALRGAFKQIEKRAYSDCSQKDSVQKEHKTKKAFVQDTISVLDKYGWHGQSGAPAWAWSDFRKISKTEYSDYLKIVEDVLPRDSALYQRLKSDFDTGLTHSKQGVRYLYLCELIASIAYISASGYYQNESEENKNGN
ncbi:MAG: hypothetical protein KH359_04430 [Clostridiales bacterium]|nr:hypothetical protein [Clostridiales bacterium]